MDIFDAVDKEVFVTRFDTEDNVVFVIGFDAVEKEVFVTELDVAVKVVAVTGFDTVDKVVLDMGIYDEDRLEKVVE